jgi:hypothetical protein
MTNSAKLTPSLAPFFLGHALDDGQGQVALGLDVVIHLVEAGHQLIDGLGQQALHPLQVLPAGLALGGAQTGDFLQQGLQFMSDRGGVLRRRDRGIGGARDAPADAQEDHHGGHQGHGNQRPCGIG